jgi:molybdopterin converting factor small subunit
VTVRVQLPPVLRHATGGERWLQANGATVAAVLSDLAENRPALALHLFDEQGEVRHNLVCVHEGIVVRAREMASHRVQADDELVLANALAGG